MEAAAPIADLIADGLAHHRAGRLREAADRYARIVEAVPGYADGWRLLGLVAFQSGDNAAARTLLERAIGIADGDAAAHALLGAVNEAEGRRELAYAAYRRACALDPTEAGAVAGLLRVALALGRVGEALEAGEAAVRAGVRDAAVLRALGAARLDVRDFAGAAQALRAALEREPHADAYANLGAACVHLRDSAAALAACNAALALDPLHAGAAINAGIAYKFNAAFPLALAAFGQAIDAGSDAAHLSLGNTLLLLGDYHAGWPHYGWVTAERRAVPAAAACPLWDGSPAPGARLLIWPDQGVGDTVMFARFLARARGLVGSLTLACPPATLDLLRRCAGVDAVVDMTAPLPLAAFDLWLPTTRLPVVFDVALDAIPAGPYLRADPRRVDRFGALLDPARGLRVGLVWSGNPQFEWNDLRSCAFADLAPLGAVPGVTFFALQQGEPRGQRIPDGMHVVPINAAVSDFADTAAIVAQLDLLITVDTSVAHIAGALGAPAWVLLGTQPDWRWLRSGDRSPWYPHLRLFRQSKDGQWGPVVAALVAELRALVRSAYPER